MKTLPFKKTTLWNNQVSDIEDFCLKTEVKNKMFNFIYIHINEKTLRGAHLS